MSQYQQFVANPWVATMEHKDRWTVSTINKVPIDAVKLVHQSVLEHRTGNYDSNLTSLPALCNTVLKYHPNNVLANACLLIDALHDQYFILDIEPNCSDEVKNHLLQLPCVYAETSMSGKGIHLVIPLPPSFLTNEIITSKKKIQKHDRTYEVMLYHPCTFSMNQIDAPNKIEINTLTPSQNAQITHFLNGLIAEAGVINTTANVDFNADEVLTYQKNPSHKMELVSSLLTDIETTKSLQNEYKNDMSRYTMHLATYIGFKIQATMQQYKLINPAILLSTEETIALMHEYVVQRVPHRAKHETKRNGVPFLIYTSHKALEYVLAECAKTIPQ